MAIGDLHADLPHTLAVLRLAGLVDEGGAWAGGDTVFVQTGDVTDRGPDSKEVIELLQRLEASAPATGGLVIALLGNHEAMNLTGDWRYVSQADVDDFGTVEARKGAFSPGAPLGDWLLARDAVARVGDTIFVHGGVNPTWAARGVDGINGDVHDALGQLDTAGGLARARAAPVLGPEGPLWYRGLALADAAIACEELGRALGLLSAARMVAGHNTQESGLVGERCEGRLLLIDTGLSAHYGGHHAALEILDGHARALYDGETRDLPDPPAAAPTAAPARAVNSAEMPRH